MLRNKVIYLNVLMMKANNKAYVDLFSVNMKYYCPDLKMFTENKSTSANCLFMVQNHSFFLSKLHRTARMAGQSEDILILRYFVFLR